MPPPVADERDALLAFLAQQRYVLRLTAFGLTDDQARATPLVGGLSVGGLIKHVAETERSWLDIMLQRPSTSDLDYESGFRMGDSETLADIYARYDAVADETTSAVASIADLGQAVPAPRGVPWFPQDVAAWSVRWVLLHVIEETARHAGHADTVREAVDGGTAFPIMAAAENWPPSDWMQPWRPAPPSR
jgi:uncharacterized damage-inducible protein DinB